MSSKYGGITREQSYKIRTQREKESGYVKFHLTEKDIKKETEEVKKYNSNLFLEKLNDFKKEPTIEKLAWLVTNMDYGDSKSTINQNRLIKEICYDIATKSTDTGTSSK